MTFGCPKTYENSTRINRDPNVIICGLNGKREICPEANLENRSWLHRFETFPTFIDFLIDIPPVYLAADKIEIEK